MPFTIQQCGNNYSVIDDRSCQFYDNLPPAVYVLKFNPNMGYYLEGVNSFVRPAKTYGDINKNCDLILKTYFDREKSTGVLLSGLKGAGKSQLARLISIDAIEKHGIPTILVCSPFFGEAFNKFIQSIEQRCVVVFDEFEKVYDAEEQQQMLSLLDGVFQSQKLFILTVNDKYRLDDNMRNRPGRLYYSFDYSSLPSSFVREVAEDKLLNKSKLDEVVETIEIIHDVNFDTVAALVEEVNRYPEERVSDLLKRLNIKPEYQADMVYSVSVTEIKTGKVIPLEYSTVSLSPFKEFSRKEVYGAYDRGKSRKEKEFEGHCFEFDSSHLKQIKGNKLMMFEIEPDASGDPRFRIVLIRKENNYDYSRFLAY